MIHKILFILALISFSLTASAQDKLNQIKKEYPDDYEYTQSSCNQWADDDQLTGQEKQAFVKDCILEELGYLVEDDSEPSSEVQYD